MKQLFIAQKAVILNKTKTKILILKYRKSKYSPAKINGKLGLPGGKIDFGEDPDESFIREIREETGITIKPGKPFGIWTWRYNKGKDKVQIVAVARMGFYESGKLIGSKKESETEIEKVEWVNIKEFPFEALIEDEIDIVRNLLRNIDRHKI